MQFDSHFEIGATHDVCQDYALCGNVNDHIGYAIVSDGCSMSHKMGGQVDCGARVLSHSAKIALKKIWYEKQCVDTIIEGINKNYRNEIIKISTETAKKMDLDDMFSDCTIISACLDKNGNANVFMYGDGNVYVGFKDGSNLIIEVSFLSNAPFYLSYQNDAERLSNYLKTFGNMVLVDRYSTANGSTTYQINSQQISVSDPDFYEKTMFNFSNVSFISVMSDGVKSFQRIDGETISSVNVVREFNAFKNRAGVFVKRRLNAMSKAFEKDGIYHYDDISLSSISL